MGAKSFKNKKKRKKKVGGEEKIKFQKKLRKGRGQNKVAKKN